MAGYIDTQWEYNKCILLIVYEWYGIEVLFSQTGAGCNAVWLNTDDRSIQYMKGNREAALDYYLEAGTEPGHILTSPLNIHTHLCTAVSEN